MQTTTRPTTIHDTTTSWPSSATTTSAAAVDVDNQLTLACQDPENLDLWFAERGDDVERAKALCADCPLRAACLAGAIERSEPWGVWGGEVFVEGRVVPRKRGRGRPRKEDAARWAAA